ncbi:MAG: hypothetical protein GTO12_15845 [Proteobacteria bacterium]|nr:hypothetical protein [Pseudomonadota bacterium]
MRAERRSYPRVQASRTVMYSGDFDIRSRVSRTVDLALEGARIETTPFSLVPGEDLEISIVIRPQVIRCRGKVIHILRLPGDRLQAGVQFQEMAKRDRILLGEYISSFMEQRNKGNNASP